MWNTNSLTDAIERDLRTVEWDATGWANHVPAEVANDAVFKDGYYHGQLEAPLMGSPETGSEAQNATATHNDTATPA